MKKYLPILLLVSCAISAMEQLPSTATNNESKVYPGVIYKQLSDMTIDQYTKYHKAAVGESIGYSTQTFSGAYTDNYDEIYTYLCAMREEVAIDTEGKIVGAWVNIPYETSSTASTMKSLAHIKDLTNAYTPQEGEKVVTICNTLPRNDYNNLEKELFERALEQAEKDGASTVLFGSAACAIDEQEMLKELGFTQLKDIIFTPTVKDNKPSRRILMHLVIKKLTQQTEQKSSSWFGLW